jgi:two-component system response regulator
MNEDASYQVQRVALQPDDVLLLYSDGATDERSPRGEFFGRERLVEVLSANRHKPPQYVLHRIEEALLEHRGDSHQEDDITLVVLKREC